MGYIPEERKLHWVDAIPVVTAQLPYIRPQIVTPRYRYGDNPLKGCCYAASEALHHLIKEETDAYCARWGDKPHQTHWFLRLPAEGDRVIDVTASQFPEDNFPHLHREGVRKSFMPKPSRRARLILDRIKHKDYFRPPL